MTPEQFDAILDDIAAHGNTRKAIRESTNDLKGFYAKLAQDDDAAKRYARAKELGCASLSDEILDIADSPQRGIKTTTKADGSMETVEGDMVDRARLQVDSRKWLLSKLVPKKYGDALALEHSGNVGLTVTRKDESLL